MRSTFRPDAGPKDDRACARESAVDLSSGYRTSGRPRLRAWGTTREEAWSSRRLRDGVGLPSRIRVPPVRDPWLPRDGRSTGPPAPRTPGRLGHGHSLPGPWTRRPVNPGDAPDGVCYQFQLVGNLADYQSEIACPRTQLGAFPSVHRYSFAGRLADWFRPGGSRGQLGQLPGRAGGYPMEALLILGLLHVRVEIEPTPGRR